MKITLFFTCGIIILSCSNSKNNNSDKVESKNLHVGETPIYDTTKLSVTSEMLDEDLYWTIIEKSLVNNSDQENQKNILIKEIEKLTPKEIIGFRLRTDKLLSETYNSEMWCAGYIMNGGCSDDGFEYFRNWVISRGKQTYYNSKSNPDYLINEVVDGIPYYYEFEEFWYVALDAFKHKTGQNLYDYIDYEGFKSKEGNYPQFEFTWSEEKPESMRKICPQLFDKLWDN